MSKTILKALYEQLKVHDKRNLCPRAGIYKVIATYNGKCYGKQALMAKCNWRTTTSNNYLTNFEVNIQLESFKRTATEEQLELLTSSELVGKEIDVLAADYNEGEKIFNVAWKFLEIEANAIQQLNDRIKSGHVIDFDFDETLDNIDLDGDVSADY